VTSSWSTLNRHASILGWVPARRCQMHTCTISWEPPAGTWSAASLPPSPGPPTQLLAQRWPVSAPTADGTLRRHPALADRRSFVSGQPRLRTIRNKIAVAVFYRADNAGQGQHYEQGHMGRSRMPRSGRLRHADANRRDHGGRRGRSCRGRPSRRGSRRRSGCGGDRSWCAAWRRILSPSLPLDRSVRLRSHAQLVPVKRRLSGRWEAWGGGFGAAVGVWVRLVASRGATYRFLNDTTVPTARLPAPIRRRPVPVNT
jgi:hypothetical protein